jgi:hypothetical protein
MLHLALELDRRTYRGVAHSPALAELRRSRRFDVGMLDALRNYAPERAEFELRRLPIQELRAGMVLENDVLTKDGNLLIFKAGTILTETWIGRQHNFARTRGSQNVLDVRIPKRAPVRNLEELSYGLPETGPRQR